MPKASRVPYTQEALNQAVAAVKDGMAKKQAARQFGVPKATIQFRLSTKFKKVSLGPPPVLSEEEENLLAEWIAVCARKGQPRRSEDLKLSVKEMLDKANRPNPFTYNKPGDGWYRAFLRRHPNISLRTPEEVTWASACISEPDIRKWFSQVQASLEEDGCADVLSDPTRLFNCDETGFPLNPKNGKVLVSKGEKNVYEVDKGPAKTNITVLYCFSASGTLVPPLIIFPYKSRIPGDISMSVAAVSDDWGIGHSETGWMTSEVFYEYVGKIFNEFVTKQGIKKPVVLFVDGHKTHLTYELSKLCNELGIILIVLYPNATRILQPCDVGIFRPLKAAWKRESLAWYHSHPGEIITKVCFSPILKDAMKSISKETMINSFKASGLYPFNCDSIDFTKCLGGKSCKPQSTPEKYLKKSDFLEIIGTSLNILSKKPENEAEDILQRINAAFTSQKPIRNDTILNIDFSTGNSSSTPRTRSGEPDTEAGNENLSFNEEIDFNSNILQTSGFSDFIASLTPPRMSSTHDQAILLPPRLSPSADINVIQIPSRSSSTTDIHTTLTPPTVTASTSTAHATQPLPELLPVSTDLQIPATSSIPSQPNKLEDILNWPLTPKRKGKRNVSRDSYVVSSKQWQNEQEEKIQAKEKMLKEKEEKKQRRKENKVKKSEAQKKKAQKIKKPRVLSSDSSESSAEVSSGESDWEEPSENEDSKEHGWIAPQRSVDEYVVTKYDNRFFPGKILSVSETEATVTCMMKCGRLWKWPERPDILNYGWDSVVSHINEPKKVSKTRNVYSVPELENVWH